MKTTLTKAELDALLPNIQRVLDTGTPWNDESLHLPARALIDAVLEIEGMIRRPVEQDDEGFSTNGWQWDWWQAVAYKGKNYTLSGSGYCGGHAFHVSD